MPSERRVARACWSRLPRLVVAAALALFLLVAACTGGDGPQAESAPPGISEPTGDDEGQPGGPPDTPPTSDPRAGFSIRIHGPRGDGFAQIVLDPEAAEVCFEIEVGSAGVARVEIREGEEGSAVIMWEPPDDGAAVGCVDAAGDGLERILADPAAFSVAVATSDGDGGLFVGPLES